MTLNTHKQDQPMGDKETRLGAENRVKNVMEKMKDKLPDFVVGLEGGVEKVGSTLYCMAWYVVPIQHSLTHTHTHTKQDVRRGDQNHVQLRLQVSILSTPT